MKKVLLREFDEPVGYAKGLELQENVRKRLMAGEGGPELIILQHKPVITLGKNAGEEGVLASREVLAASGVELFRVGRGGQATVHSPGQLVAYPILNLRELGLSPRNYVTALEEWLMKSCSELGVETFRVDKKPGIYTKNGKIGALGVAISGGYSMHGVALNVANDLSLFDLILPCGESRIKPVSLQREGAGKDTGQVYGVLARNFARIFGVALIKA